jgi:hypothetical protein
VFIFVIFTINAKLFPPLASFPEHFQRFLHVQVLMLQKPAQPVVTRLNPIEVRAVKAIWEQTYIIFRAKKLDVYRIGDLYNTEAFEPL